MWLVVALKVRLDFEASLKRGALLLAKGLVASSEG
jgi:hypothetical protein